MSIATQDRLKPFLHRLTTHSKLTRAEQGGFLELPSREHRVSAHVDLVRLQESAGHAFMVMEGLVCRFDQTSAGARQIESLHIAGDMPDVGAVALPESASALHTLSDCQLLSVSHTAIREAVAEYPALGEALWRDCRVDAAILRQWLVNLGRRSALERVAHLYCEMATRLGVAPATGQIRFRLQMTQQQLGDATGLTPVHVNRVLRALRDTGLTVRRDLVWIEDWAALCGAADFQPQYLQREPPIERRMMAA